MINHYLKNILLSLLLTTSCATYASDVYIETTFDFGRGILRAVEQTCFIYTPKHVVAETETITITSRLQRNIPAQIVAQYPNDLALLQVEQQHNDLCNESTWQDNNQRISSILSTTSKATLDLRAASGASTELAITITQKDVHSYFYIALADTNKTIKQGMSGSIVSVAGYPIGMLLSVNGNVGKVLRMDEIANTSRTVVDQYRTATGKAQANTTNVSGFQNAQQTQQDDITSKSYSTTVFKGEIKQGERKVFPIISFGHTAYKLTSNKQNQKAKMNLYFQNPAEKQLSRTTLYTDKDTMWGFGTLEEGEHYLVIEGSKNGGSFNLTLETIATPNELTGETNILNNGDVAKGFIAKGTKAIYKINTLGNTAFKLTSSKQKQKTKINLYFLNPAEESLARTAFYTDKKTIWGFGTQEEGEHYLIIEGQGDVGSFHLTMETVATPNELTGEANILSSGDVAKGYISKGTKAIYRINTAGNTAFKLTSNKQSKKTKINLYFQNPDEETLAKTSFYTDKKTIFGVGTVEQGEHYLVIEGRGEVGSFHLKLETIATTNELISKDNKLQPNQAVSGNIAKGTAAVYQFEAKANQQYSLKFFKQSNKARVYVEITDPDLKSVKRKRVTLKKNESIKFTTRNNGIYQVVIKGIYEWGKYKMALTPI